MVFCYIHRLVHSTGLVRDAPSWNRWLLTQTPIANQVAGLRDCVCNSRPQTGHLYSSLSQSSQVTVRKEMGRL